MSKNQELLLGVFGCYCAYTAVVIGLWIAAFSAGDRNGAVALSAVLAIASPCGIVLSVLWWSYGRKSNP